MRFFLPDFISTREQSPQDPVSESIYICPVIPRGEEAKQHGALAHLGRAFGSQSKGDEFESRMLHFLNYFHTAYNHSTRLYTIVESGAVDF